MRTTKYIYLNPSDVQNFVHAAEHCDFDIDIANDRYGRYVVDAKSFLGVMGLDLRGRLAVSYNGYDEAFEQFLNSSQMAV